MYPEDDGLPTGTSTENNAQTLRDNMVRDPMRGASLPESKAEFCGGAPKFDRRAECPYLN